MQHVDLHVARRFSDSGIFDVSRVSCWRLTSWPRSYPGCPAGGYLLEVTSCTRPAAPGDALPAVDGRVRRQGCLAPPLLPLPSRSLRRRCGPGAAPHRGCSQRPPRGPEGPACALLGALLGGTDPAAGSPPLPLFSDSGIFDGAVAPGRSQTPGFLMYPGCPAGCPG